MNSKVYKNSMSKNYLLNKSKFIFFMCIIACNSVFSQIAYYDALKLSGMLDNTKHFPATKKDSVLSILEKYISSDMTTPASFSDSTKNPFTAKYFNAAEAFDDNFAKIAGSFSPSAMGGLDVTNIANGVADFMIERSKEELTVAFFSKFRTFSEKNPEFKTLFPNTADNLINLLSYQYPQMLPALRTGFLDDLSKLSSRIDDVLKLPRYAELLKEFPEVRIAVRSLELIHKLESEESTAADILDEFANFEEWDEESASTEIKNTGNSLKLASVFSGSLRNDTAQSHTRNIWINSKQLRKLLSNKEAFRIYVGLIYQQSKKGNIQFVAGTKTIKFSELLAEKKKDLFLVEDKIREFVQLAIQVDESIQNINDKNKKGEKPSNDDFYNYINTSIDAVEYGFSIAKLFNDSIKTGEYIVIARKSNSLFKNVYRKEYPQAVLNSIDILSKIYDLAANSPKYDKLSSETKEALKKTDDFISKYLTYGLFIANVAVATSSDEVKAAIESAALPVGSSSIKKNSAFNISVQSYLGAYAIISSTGSKSNSWNDQFGVTAPIGVSFSKGMGAAGSLSIFTSLFDIAAIVDYKLTYDTLAPTSKTATKDYKIKLEQIVAPGAYLVYGFPFNVPLSIGIGAQYGPGLSEISTAGGATVLSPTWRGSAFLSVDIPFFNLLTIRKDKHKAKSCSCSLKCKKKTK